MDKNIQEFKNPLHQSLWRAYINKFPLERTTAWIDDELLLESCRQLYHYVMDAYDDILENPQEYGIMPEEWGNWGEKINFHINILINPLRRSYGSFLDIAAIRQNEYLIMNTQDYDKLLKDVKNKKYNKIKIFTEDGIFEKLFNTLSQRGIIIEHNETETIIRNNKYPQMFLAADLLFQADLKYYNRTKRSPQFFSLMDFREIYEDKRKWDVEDIICGLSDDQKGYVYKFIDYISQKVRLRKSCEIWYYRTAEFTYKKKMLFIIRWGKSYAFDIGIPFPDPGSDEYRRFESEINKLSISEEIKDFCIKNLKRCRFCGPYCMKQNAHKKDWLFFGRSLDQLVRSCEPYIMVDNFNETNYNYFKTLIDIYVNCLSNK